MNLIDRFKNLQKANIAEIPYRDFSKTGVFPTMWQTAIEWNGGYWIPYIANWSTLMFYSFRVNFVGMLLAKIHYLRYWYREHDLVSWLYLKLYQRGFIEESDQHTLRDFRPLRLFSLKTKWWLVYGWDGQTRRGIDNYRKRKRTERIAAICKPFQRFADILTGEVYPVGGFKVKSGIIDCTLRVEHGIFVCISCDVELCAWKTPAMRGYEEWKRVYMQRNSSFHGAESIKC